MILRVAFVVLAVAAIAGTTYVSFYGMGRESTDTQRSVRVGSGGNVMSGGRVK
ncbi:hypothetical protein M8756_14065 [Lutimaribacter sp. EGI FJ00015]|uniref:Uncharacterized protein n=1 Tax=Lutimaribacter degradans TaxID=2945989 RepID=A0ACC5ZY58_9RHOB|nr:hypothetical protein [Lutimaribacter sp. EGI FJ00013]MCM2563237.1 hypothetical protein [Lutimaribacter sp. EGI FJ00013]MCO0614440.1 hypothetical protein [Lutimaribacter sp. EGI FJ00015]MCO0635959.1 hypothetical protein [Lutimaribacter sp. EGI FJ00014]